MPSARDRFAGQTFGIYPRVSTLTQGDDEKVSLDAQIEACKEYGEELDMVLDSVCVRKERFTSTKMNRPELNALLRDLRARSVPNLVIDRADRLTRSGMLAAATLLTRFTDAGILLHIVSMDLIVEDEQGVKLFLDAAFAAQQFNAAKTHAVRRARRYSAKHKGRYARGNRPPFGWRFEITESDDKGKPVNWKLVHDDATYPVRRRILALRAAGIINVHSINRQQ